MNCFPGTPAPIRLPFLNRFFLTASDYRVHDENIMARCLTTTAFIVRELP
jgi:hypothetical protein